MIDPTKGISFNLHLKLTLLSENAIANSNISLILLYIPKETCTEQFNKQSNTKQNKILRFSLKTKQKPKVYHQNFTL